jgi:hypothetical protein
MAAKRKASRAAPYATRLALNTARLDRIEPVLEKISTRLGHIETELIRYKGFWGGITLIGGAVWVLITTFKDNILAFFRN